MGEAYEGPRAEDVKEALAYYGASAHTGSRQFKILASAARAYLASQEQTPDKGQALLAALEAGIVTRRWSCGSDKAECVPGEDWGYLHYSCRWYWSIWSVEQDKIEALYQAALVGFHPQSEGDER